jgi:hypothetical protein
MCDDAACPAHDVLAGEQVVNSATASVAPDIHRTEPSLAGQLKLFVSERHC